MAGRATFGFEYRVFILEWTRCFCVALCADKALLCRRALKLLSEAAVGFVTVRAQDQPLNHFVPGRGREFRPLFIVALEAEGRLGRCEEIFRFVRAVNAVTANATYIASAMSRTLKGHMLSGVAFQANTADLFGGSACQVDDLCLVPAALDVRLARPVALRARHASKMRQIGLSRVRTLSKACNDLFMTSGTIGGIARNGGCGS